MRETLGVLIKSHNFLKISQNDLSSRNFLGVPIQALGGDNKKMRNTVSQIIESYKALSSTGCTGKSTKRESVILAFDKLLIEIGFARDGDREGAPKKLPRDELLKKWRD